MSFKQSLKGGHPNSLGNTLEVVNAVLGNTDKMEVLFLCYQLKKEKCMNGSIRCKNDFLVNHNSNAILKLDPPGR